MIYKHDTLSVERCFVDTFVKFESDTAALRALIECDSLGNALIAEIETLNGERVSVAPTIEYRYITDESGQIRREAYISVVALADSLQRQVSILEEKIQAGQTTDINAEEETKTKNYATIFLIGFVVGVLLLFISLMLLKIK